VPQQLTFAKGHGTGNDFVIVPDPAGELDLSADVVAALCDRRQGIGADGVLRIVRTAACPEVAATADAAEWFMDYRNADGSLAQMCGNGVRVFARYLVDSGLAVGPTVVVLTRAGVVTAEIGDAAITVDMPVPRVGGESTAQLSDVDLKGTVAECGNPNLVCRVPDPAALDLTRAPVLDRDIFPHGANVEFYTLDGPVDGADLHVRMRVVERGVGETMSCGSGACAVAGVALGDQGREAGVVVVDVPGGRLTVTVDGARCLLAGPAVVVARGVVTI
jgi:diaminopimelate epimerase